MEPNKRFKSNSIAESQEIIRRHVNARREISTALSAEIISSASSTLIISPSGRRMRESRPSQAQNRTLDEIRSVAVGPTGGDSRSAIGSSTAPIGADNMYPMMGERWSESEAFRHGEKGDY